MYLNEIMGLLTALKKLKAHTAMKNTHAHLKNRGKVRELSDAEGFCPKA